MLIHPFQKGHCGNRWWGLKAPSQKQKIRFFHARAAQINKCDQCAEAVQLKMRHIWMLPCFVHFGLSSSDLTPTSTRRALQFIWGSQESRVGFVFFSMCADDELAPVEAIKLNVVAAVTAGCASADTHPLNLTRGWCIELQVKTVNIHMTRTQAGGGEFTGSENTIPCHSSCDESCKMQ